MDTKDLMTLMKLTGKDKETCYRVLKTCEGDVNKAFELLGGKQKKEKKLFNVGDIIICTNPKSSKLGPEAIEFLLTYKYFKILDVNENKNIHIGYVNNEGKAFYFSPNRFELRDKPKEVPPPPQPTPKPQYEPMSVKREKYEDSPDDYYSGWK